MTSPCTGLSCWCSWTTPTARRTLSNTKMLSSAVMSFFTCGKKAEDSEQNDALKTLAENVRWEFLIDGTCFEMAYKKVTSCTLHVCFAVQRESIKFDHSSIVNVCHLVGKGIKRINEVLSDASYLIHSPQTQLTLWLLHEQLRADPAMQDDELRVQEHALKKDKAAANKLTSTNKLRVKESIVVAAPAKKKTKTTNGWSSMQNRQTQVIHK